MSNLFESKSVSGERIKVNVLHHDEKLCKEIIVESPKFNKRKWFLWSFFIYLIGFYFQLHYQDIKLMLTLIIFLLLIICLKTNLKVTQESLLIVASVGVQLTTKFASGRTSSMFYEAQNIHDIVINEGITMHQVIYYICLLLHNCTTRELTNVIPLFKCSWPSLECLKIIRREIRPIIKCSLSYLPRHNLT